MNDLRYALRQLLKNPGFGGSDEWLVMSDELGKVTLMPLSHSAHHLSLITHHYE